MEWMELTHIWFGLNHLTFMDEYKNLLHTHTLYQQMPCFSIMDCFGLVSKIVKLSPKFPQCIWKAPNALEYPSQKRRRILFQGFRRVLEVMPTYRCKVPPIFKQQVQDPSHSYHVVIDVPMFRSMMKLSPCALWWVRPMGRGYSQKQRALQMC